MVKLAHSLTFQVLRVSLSSGARIAPHQVLANLIVPCFLSSFIVHPSISISISTCISSSPSPHLYLHLHLHISISISISTCTSSSPSPHLYLHIHIHIHLHIFIFIPTSLSPSPSPSIYRQASLLYFTATSRRSNVVPTALVKTIIKISCGSLHHKENHSHSLYFFLTRTRY